MKRKKYCVCLNGKYIADFRTLRGCLNFIERRKLEANYDNDLSIIDNEGNEYHPYTGEMMNESLRKNLSLNENYIKEIKRTLNYNDIIRTIEHITGAFDVTYTQEINDMVIHIYEPDYRDAYICVKVFDYMYEDVYFSEEVKYDRSETCYRKIYNAYKKAVSLCEKHSLMESKRINEWNMWDGDRRSSYPRQTRMIDVRKSIHNKARYNNDPEYHEHIKRLEDELRRTDDPQHAEYLERRINKLKSLSEGVKLSRTSRAIRESLSKKYKIHNKINESINTKETEYIGGKFLIDETDFNNLPMFSHVNIGNVGWEELYQEYGYSPSMTFEKVDRDVWKLVSVFIPKPIGKPNRSVNVSDGIEVSIREILKHNVYKVSGKTYENNDIYVAVPLHRPDGDMNVLYMHRGSDNFKYDDRVTLIKLLKSHDKNNDALFKFSTIREDDTIIINICLDNGNKYYLKCNYKEIDDFLRKNSKRVFRNNFNTYF